MIVPRVAPAALALLAALAPADADRRVRDALESGNAEAAIAALPAAVDAWTTKAKADPEAAATALDALGSSIFDASGGSPEGAAAAERAVTRARELRVEAFGESDLRTAASDSNLSTLAFLRGRFDEAETWERRALEIRSAKLPPDAAEVATSAADLGIVLARAGRLAESEALLREAVRHRKADDPRLVEDKNSLAEVLRQQDRLAESKAMFEETVRAVEAQGPESSLLLARVVNNLAGLLKDQGNLAEAEALTRRSLALREGQEKPDPADVSIGTLNLAEIYRLEGNLAEAEPLYLKSIEQARAGLGPDHPDLAIHLAQLAVLYREQKRYGEARTSSDEAIALLERTVGPEHPLVAQALHDRGALERESGKAADALPRLTRALALREAAYGPDHYEVAATLTELAGAEIEAGGEAAAGARAHLDRALAILETTEAYPETAVDARTLRAATAADDAAALADLEKAAAALEALRPVAGGGEATRAAFFAKHAVVYDRLVDRLLARGRIADAFLWSERARGRALLDQLASADVDVTRGIPEPRRSELAAKRAAARTALAEWQARSDALASRDDLDAATRRARLEEARAGLKTAAAALRRVDEETKNESPAWRAASGGAPADLEAARRLLLPRERMLVYQIGREASWLIDVAGGTEEPTAYPLAVDAEAARATDLPVGPLTAAGLARLLRGPAGLLAELARPPVAGFPDESASALEGLYRVLVPEPARPGLAAARAVVLVPAGPLTGLPFEALVTTRGARGRTAYWIDRGPPIRYAVSATVLRALGSRGPVDGGGGLLTVADPAYPSGSRWTPLPGTARESDAVAAALEKREVEVTRLRGAGATEAAVRAALGGHRYLHFAVHGLVDAGRGDLLAALALAPSAAPAPPPSDDGLLQLHEIYELDMTSEVAVLSACATHSGTEVAGEGVFALSRGFLARGARRVVASQWAVDDASTARLIERFFDAVASDGPSKSAPDYAAALAGAKRRIRSEAATSAPFYWAPFVMTGLR